VGQTGITASSSFFHLILEKKKEKERTWERWDHRWKVCCIVPSKRFIGHTDDCM
jgi:hypothetical protein